MQAGSANTFALPNSWSEHTCDKAHVHQHVSFQMQASRFLMSRVTVATVTDQSVYYVSSYSQLL